MTNTKACTVCGGIMRVPCEICAGSGVITKFFQTQFFNNYMDELCPICHGTGIIPCSECAAEPVYESEGEYYSFF